MSHHPYYGPVGQDADSIYLEKTFMAAGYLTGLGFGIQFVIYLACVKILWQRKPRTRLTTALLFYITFLCSMNLIWSGTSAYGLQLTYIDNRNYPGGPYAFLQVEFSLPSNVLSLASYIAGNILADILLIWRCHVIWSASVGIELCSVAAAITLFSSVVLLASLSMAILFAYETASPRGFFSKQAVGFAVPYFGLSLGLNIFLTIMIVVRMWYYRQQGRRIFGRNYGRHYTSLSAMFIESAALYAICSALLLGSFIPQHPINQIWLGLEPAVQMISSYLIIYRVVEGRAWNSETFTKSGMLSTMTFDTKTTRTQTDRDALRTETDAIELPLHSLAGKGKSGEKHGLQVTASMKTDTDRSSSVMWVTQETV